MKKMKEFWSWLEDSDPPKNWRESKEYLNVADLLEKTFTEGPGIRFAIWLQGCPIRCKGCWNQHMWDFTPKHVVKVEKLVEYILSFNNDIEGITLVGGEPLFQAKGVVNLMYRIKRESNLSIVLYTGYSVEQITTKYALEAFNMADIVITGPYIEEKRNIFLRWRGSENQKVIFHNKIYKKKYSKKTIMNIAELHIDKASGEVVLIGFPDDDLLRGVKNE